MKTRKFLLFVLALALISSLLIIVPSADGGNVVISEDYNSVTYNGNDYVYFPEAISGNSDQTFIPDSEFSLTDEQKAEISSITAYASEDVYIHISISFEKGGYLEDYYINVDYIDDYETFLAEGGAQYVFYDHENYEEIHLKRADIFKNPVKVKSYEVYYYENYSPVHTISTDGYFSVYSGDILCDNEGNYYYYDHLSAPVGEHVTLWKLDGAIFEEDINFYPDYDGNELIIGLSAVIISLFLGAIPLAALIVCLVLSFRSKQPYRRGLRITAILCAVELVAFITTMILLLAS